MQNLTDQSMIPSQLTKVNGSSLLPNATPVSKETQPQSLSVEYVVLKTLFFAAIAAAGLIGNGLVLATVVRLRKVRAPCDLLVASICLADLGVSIVAAPLRIFEVYNGLVIGEVLYFGAAARCFRKRLRCNTHRNRSVSVPCCCLAV